MSAFPEIHKDVTIEIDYVISVDCFNEDKSTRGAQELSFWINWEPICLFINLYPYTPVLYFFGLLSDLPMQRMFQSDFKTQLP